MSQKPRQLPDPDRGIAIASDDLAWQRLGVVGSVYHPLFGAGQAWSGHLTRWRLPSGPQAVIDLQCLPAGGGRMTSAGPQGDALQQIGGNKGAGHDASLTVASDKMAQKCSAFWSQRWFDESTATACSMLTGRLHSVLLTIGGEF